MMANHSTIAMPTLAFLLEGMVDIPVTADLPVFALRIDSRLVQPGDLFIALEGLHTSGTRFVHEALARGATAIIADTKSGLDVALAVPVWRVPELQSRLGLIASRFFGNPSRDLSITGITGTNGKTSMASRRLAV
jgi:UDP-N-acetylmuramoyl-L-alanyl-D-glutamate--2,6-diaminopimelate ligase